MEGKVGIWMEISCGSLLKWENYSLNTAALEGILLKIVSVYILFIVYRGFYSLLGERTNM